MAGLRDLIEKPQGLERDFALAQAKSADNQPVPGLPEAAPQAARFSDVRPPNMGGTRPSFDPMRDAANAAAASNNRGGDKFDAGVMDAIDTMRGAASNLGPRSDAGDMGVDPAAAIALPGAALFKKGLDSLPSAKRVGEAASNAASRVSGVVGDTIDGARRIGGDLMEGARSGKGAGMGEKISRAAGDFADAAKAKTPAAADFSVRGAGEGLRGAWNWAANKVDEFGRGVKGEAPKATPIPAQVAARGAQVAPAADPYLGEYGGKPDPFAGEYERAGKYQQPAANAAGPKPYIAPEPGLGAAPTAKPHLRGAYATTNPVPGTTPAGQPVQPGTSVVARPNWIPGGNPPPPGGYPSSTVLPGNTVEGSAAPVNEAAGTRAGAARAAGVGGTAPNGGWSGVPPAPPSAGGGASTPPPPAGPSLATRAGNAYGAVRAPMTGFMAGTGGVLAAGVEGYNQAGNVKDIVTNPDMSAGEKTLAMGEPVGRVASAGAGAIMGGAAGGKLGYKMGSILGKKGSLVGGLVGGLAGGTVGAIYGPEGASKAIQGGKALFGLDGAPAGARTSSGKIGLPTPGTSPNALDREDANDFAPAKPEGSIPTLRGGNVTPEQLIAGKEIPQQGYGAIKRKGGEAIQIGDGRQDTFAPMDAATRAYQYAPQGGESRPGQNEMPTSGIQPGGLSNPFNRDVIRNGFSAAGGAVGAAVNEAGLMRRADRDTKNSANQLAAMKFGHEISKDQRDYATQRSDKEIEHGFKAVEAARAQQKQSAEQGEANRKKIGDDIANNADADTPPLTSGIFGAPGADARAMRDQQVKQRAATVKQDFQYTSEKYGIPVERLSGSKSQYLHDAARVKAKYEANPDSLGPQFREFARTYFGDNKVTSRDLLSYMPLTKAQAKDAGLPPAQASSATLMGSGRYLIEMPNGAKMEAKKLQGGQLQWLGANKAMDVDMARLIQPIIDEYEKGRK